MAMRSHSNERVCHQSWKSTPLTIGFDGSLYEFKKDVSVEIPYLGAKQIFGDDDGDVEAALVRLGLDTTS
jgi:hypothetical protein